MNNIKCLECGKEFKFLNNTHLKRHNLTIQEYKNKWNIKESLVCDDLKKVRGDYTRGKTYEQIHGRATAQRLKELRCIHTTNQMNDVNQRLLRKKVCGKWAADADEYLSRTSKMKIACQNPDVIKRRRETLLKRYNTSNTLRIQPRFSKMAYEYIKNYIKQNNLDVSCCYYAKGGINNREYVYFDSDTQKHIMFDLVVINNETKKIELIFEYNGPFHWTEDDVRQDPYSSSTWFKTNSMTKLESYNYDQYKLNIAKKISTNVVVYWLRDNRIEQVK
jgi:hypothetical protein